MWTRADQCRHHIRLHGSALVGMGPQWHGSEMVTGPKWSTQVRNGRNRERGENVAAKPRIRTPLVSGLDLEFLISRFGFQVSGLGCQVSGLGPGVQDFRFWVLVVGPKVPGASFWTSGIGVIIC